jgi:hypothetical protein
MKWVIVFYTSLVILVVADRHLNANGPFGKRHTMDSELGHTHPCHRGTGLPSAASIYPTIVTMSTLNVTATMYSSNEQINISWIPISSPCKDDFLGIYFVENPLSVGKYFRFVRLGE